MASSTALAPVDQEDFFHPASVPDRFKKAVGVVQVAMGDLGFLHRKIFNVLYANASEGIEKGILKYGIHIASLAEGAGFDSNDYRLVYDRLSEIESTASDFLDFDFDPKTTKGRKRRKITRTSLISSFTICDDGMIYYEFSSKMAELLADPDRYIWMVLSVQRKLDSKYELALFENCVRYVGVGSTGLKDVDDWRKLLTATDPTYDEYKHFNNLVLKKATKGVNQKSGIIVEPEVEREKRRVKRLGFKVRENPQMFLLDHQRESRQRETEAYKALRDMGLTDVEALHWLDAKGEDAVLETVTYVKGQKIKKSPQAYLIDALSRGYGEKTPEERRKAVEGRAKAKELKAARAAKEEAEREEEALKLRFKARQEARYADVLAGQGKAELEVFGVVVKDALPQMPAYLKRWEAVGRDYRKLDPDNMTDGGILRFVRLEALKRWGVDADHDLEAFRELEISEKRKSRKTE